MSKFAGLLPDIDVGQDVFETEDSPTQIGNSAYDSDDSLHRITLRHLQSATPRNLPSSRSKNGMGADGSIDEGGLPRKGEVERMFRRGRKKEIQSGKEDSNYTFRPRLPPLDPSSSTPSSPTTSSSENEDKSDPHVITTKTASRNKKHQTISKEVAVVRMRRLRMEMMELERGLARGMEQEKSEKDGNQEEGYSVPGEGVVPSGTEARETPHSVDATQSITVTSIPTKDLLAPVIKRPKPALPTSSDLMSQLSGMKVSLEKMEHGLSVGEGVGGMGDGLDVTRGEGEVLLRKLENLGKGSQQDDASGIISIKQQPMTQSIITESTSLLPAENIADLDNRLAALELAIGTDNAPTDPLTSSNSTSGINQPVLPTLARLENLINLLSQPRQLDNVSRRIKVLVADLDKVNAASGGGGSGGASGGGGGGGAKPRAGGGGQAQQETPEGKVLLSLEDKKKIDDLFALLPRIDPILPIIPPLLTRLRSLAQLHASSSSFSAVLERLEQQSGEVAQSDKDMMEVVKRVEVGLEKQVEAVKGNWESLQKRLEDLDKRVGALQK